MTNRIYVPEHRQFLNGVGFDLARARQQFENAWTWYQSAPTDVNMERMEEAHEKMSKLVASIKSYHYNSDEQGTRASIRDSEQPEKDKGL